MKIYITALRGALLSVIKQRLRSKFSLICIPTIGIQGLRSLSVLDYLQTMLHF